MTQNNRETLQRAVGVLEGLSTNPDIPDVVTNMIDAVCEMIDEVLNHDT